MVVVLVDNREKNSLVPKQLEKLGVPIEYINLDVGDYLIGDFCIERKDVGDYIGSLVSGHLNDQLYAMSYNYPVSILIVEGFVDEVLMFRKLKRQQYISSLAGSILKRAPDGASGIINLVVVSTPFDTALFIYYLHKKISEGDVYRLPKIVKKPNVPLSNRILSLIANIPGVGEGRAKALLSRFNSIEKIVLASKNELMTVKNIGPKIAEEIYRVLHSKWIEKTN